MPDAPDPKPPPELPSAEAVAVGSDPKVPIYDARTPEEIAARLQGTSIEEVLRIQDQLAKFVRERYEKPIAVMFSDIAGSTAYFEKYGDAEGRRWIQRHNDLLIPVIQKRGGRVVKTIGDAIMATFPSANLAVDAAIGMQQAVHEANSRVSHEEERFEIRIGVNYGTALVNDKDGDVYGDMVNVAARVQSEAEKGQIFVSDVVREYLSPTTPLKPAGVFQLKGKSQEIALHQVLWRDVLRPDGELEKPNLGARYAVLDLLGSGGMASVWRARDEKLGRDVAVKVLHGHMAASWSTKERFQREAVVAASLVHENITQVYDYASQEAPQAFIAMELVEGEQLRAFMERNGALPTVGALLISHEIARGLSFAHARSIIHRDLKPENVLVSRMGAVKIADFGIAGVGEVVRLTQPGAQLGTPAYLSPEQVRGEPASTRSDVFSLGVMLYEMATGRSPFMAETSAATMYRIVEGAYVPPEQLAPVDPELVAIIRKCLARDADSRYGSAAEVAQELASALQRREVFDPRTALTRYFADGALPKKRDVAESTSGSRGKNEAPKSNRTATWWTGGALLGAAIVAAVAFGAKHFPLPRGEGQGEGAIAAKAADQTKPAVTAPSALPGSPVTAPPPIANTGSNSSASLPTVTANDTHAPAVDTSAPPATEHAAVPAASHHRPVTSPAAGHPKPDRNPPPSKLTESDSAPPKVSDFGTLRLSVSGGWADIKIDGVKLGRYPMQRSFTLPEGGHVLELTGNEARAPYRQRIQIEAGKTLEQKAELQPVAP